MKRKQNKEDRFEYLQSLIKEFYTTKQIGAKKEVLANLANFAYNPINYEYFRQLNIVDFFVDNLDSIDVELAHFAVSGLCNLAADPPNKAIIVNKGGVQKVSKLLGSSEKETVITSLTTLIYLVGPSSIKDTTKHLQVGDSVSISKQITDNDVKQFGQLTGDTNQVHFEGDSPVVHGALLNGLISAVIGTKLPGHGVLVVEQLLHYPKPCYVDEKLTVTVEVVSVRKVITVKYNIVVPDTMKCVLEGTAKLLFPRKPENRS